jgi:hypothetical protein
MAAHMRRSNLVFEPVNDVVRTLLGERVQHGPQISWEVDRLYPTEMDEIELGCFQILDRYLIAMTAVGFDIVKWKHPLQVAVELKKQVGWFRIQERLTRKMDSRGKQALVRTGNLCVKANGLVIAKEPDDDLIEAIPRVIRNLSRPGVDVELLRKWRLERQATAQFETLKAAGRKLYEDRARATIRRFQEMNANSVEARRASRLLTKLESVAEPIDAETIQLLRQYVQALDPLSHGVDVALRTLTYVLHGRPIN